MKIGIGIDTGGTCTDAVVYQFEEKKILAFAKTHTTKDDLSRGITRALERLPEELLKKTEIIALSTTLATNACVENKGGRAKLVFFGVSKETVLANAKEYGLPVDDSLIFIDSHTRPTGKVTKEPDWEDFSAKIQERFQDCDAVGVVEMYAKKSGAKMEKKAARLINEACHIPVVCGHQLFTENNIIKRGASTLLNARLISVIGEFMEAIKISLKRLHISAPFVIVRSDGSLMTEKFARVHPVETLLCGPVASVLGAAELTDADNCMVIDMGGTTTDIAFVKNGEPQKVKEGVHIGQWKTFVKGLFVDTFALGGDSGVIIKGDDKVGLESEKVMPLCMAASRYPKLTHYLKRTDEKASLLFTQKDEIYLGVKDIQNSFGYTKREKDIAAALYKKPMSLGMLSQQMDQSIMRSYLERLIRESVIIRCGVTPTDVMHVKGDFTRYDQQASLYGIRIMARHMHLSVEELCDQIYEEVRRKLYFHILRILMEDGIPQFRENGIGKNLEILINQAYICSREHKQAEFLGLNFSTPATLVGVGAPTHIFLKEVGKLLNAETVTSEYSMVANALGAVVGNVSAKVTIEVVSNPQTENYTVFGSGIRETMENLEEAKTFAIKLAKEKAEMEAIERGAQAGTRISLEEKEDIIETNFGPVYMGYKVTATAIGELNMEQLMQEQQAEGGLHNE